MISISTKVFKFGALSFLISGVLFSAYFITTSFVPVVPLNSAKVFDWINEWKLYIAIADELLLFATAFLLFSVYILAKILQANQFPLVLAGCTIIQFLAIPMLLLIVLLQGRLVYPVYNYPLSADMVYFISGLSIGAMHACSILFAVSIFLLSLSFRKIIAVFIGVLLFCCQLISAYPWLLNSTSNLLCQLTFPLGLLLNGILLFVNVNPEKS
jgi:hypothetical protein